MEPFHPLGRRAGRRRRPSSSRCWARPSPKKPASSTCRSTARSCCPPWPAFAAALTDRQRGGLGFAAGMLRRRAVAVIVASASLTLHQPQVAAGFVLTLLCRDLAYVLGNAYAHVPGPQVPPPRFPAWRASR